jgi:hypothetical protein
MKNILYIVIGFIIFSAVYYDSILNKPPLNMHVWRQADCLSLTKKYQEGASFFEPEMNCLLGDELTTGKTAGEFPLLYYINGKIWNITGESFFSYRLFYLFILFAGLICFYLSLILIFKNVFWSVLLTLLLYTSPAYVFYSVSFLTDAPAFSIILIALYFYLKYFLNKKNYLLFLATLFFTIAGLIKISSLIIFVFFVSIYIIELIPKIKTLGNKQLYTNKIQEGFALTVTPLLIYSWVLYAKIYSENHGFKYTFNDIFPIWKLDNYDQLIEGIKNTTSHIFYSRAMWLALLFIFILNLFTLKKNILLAYLANIIVFIGVTLYVLFWGPLFGIHDYYYLPLLSLFLSVIITFLYFIYKNNQEILNNKIVKIFGVSFLLFNFIYCVSLIRLKTFDKKGDYLSIGNTELSVLLTWHNRDLDLTWQRYFRMRDYLNEVGVNKNDKVISIGDPSFNVSLFFMARNGWSDYLNYNKSEDINVLINNGAKYLIISNESYLQKDFLTPFIQNKIGGFEGISIFKLTE